MTEHQLISDRQLEEFADRIKAITVAGVVEAGLISEKDGDEWCASHTLLCRKKSIFRTITDRFKKEPENSGRWWCIVKSTHSS